MAFAGPVITKTSFQILFSLNALVISMSSHCKNNQTLPMLLAKLCSPAELHPEQSVDEVDGDHAPVDDNVHLVITLWLHTSNTCSHVIVSQTAIKSSGAIICCADLIYDSLILCANFQSDADIIFF